MFHVPSGPLTYAGGGASWQMVRWSVGRGQVKVRVVI